ncbi:hypothetical protein ACJ72_05260 [Emergomyces africanus]|uniref:B30.2/SPRY domain-containing protein n=1 Tax=Emergomyces africanus TaxID=1955775 RepID=A0A1B7NUF4_9EURO|nr:hypothetical protein ACJ72_05260 [Emergomyces africanus]
MTTKPYPLFRLPGSFHKTSVAYLSTGHRRYNQPFTPAGYGPEYVQGDVIGVGYRPRTGTIFFTRNGKKLDDAAHGLKSQNFFPTVGANGPCTVHVNFGQMGFVFIEANVKKWGLAPMTGSLAPPPPYGSEQGSILLETGREGHQQPTQWWHHEPGHSRTRSGTIRMPYPTSPGPVRSPTDISLAQLSHVSAQPDVGEGSSGAPNVTDEHNDDGSTTTIRPAEETSAAVPPPEYSSPQHSPAHSEYGEQAPLMSRSPPIPSYDAAMRNSGGQQQQRH